MKPIAPRLLFLALATIFQCASPASAADLSFEERVAAQEAIERVYYAHQVGTTRPFEEAVPHSLIEQKVRTYLRQSVALEQFWHSPVTAEMLEAETARILRDTRMPERLQEVLQSLGRDPVLVQECLARPTLVDHLARSLLAGDARVQGAARAEAEGIRARLLSGELSRFIDAPRRSIAQVPARDASPGHMSPGGDPLRARTASRDGDSPGEEPTGAHHASGAPSPEAESGVLPLTESPDSFTVQAIVDRTGTGLTLATYTVPKVGWGEWWDAHAADFNEAAARVVAVENVVLSSSLPAAGSPPPECQPGDTWDNGILDGLPDPRKDHSVVWTGREMIVWGGVTHASSYLGVNTGGRYDPLTDRWRTTSTLNAPSGRLLHTAVWTGAEMIVWGGDTGLPGNSPYRNTGGRYNPDTDTWIPISTLNAPQARRAHRAVWAGDTMVVWGGHFDTQGYPLTSTGGRYNPATDSWTPTAINGAPPPRVATSALWTGSEMVIWGGSSSTSLFNSGGRYDPRTDTWRPTSLINAPSGRGNHAAVWTGSEMLIWGGGSYYVRYSTGGRYDPVQDRWSAMSTAGAPMQRYGHTGIWTGTELVIWGGMGPFREQDRYLDTGGRYDPSRDQWTATSVAGAPSGRVSHTAVWTSREMIVWGGSSWLNTGGRYDPSRDSWAPTSTVPGPDNRYGFTMVWTGNAMLLWGAGTSGWRYDPLLDAWIPISKTAEPQWRQEHNAIWSGEEMIVWGGKGGYSGPYFNNGGRYDPVADAWRPVSTVNAPSGRAGAAAAWTGTRMVVWGGGPRTGGQYDPASDTWTSTSIIGAPFDTVGHSVVWTGREMIVLLSNFGGRYDPERDVWASIDSRGLFSAYGGHSAVWTGSEVIYFGDHYGARYDPATNLWTRISLTGAPKGGFLRYHTAVWTGREMVVWGGSTGPATDLGGRYDPLTDAWTPISSLRVPTPRAGHKAVWTGNEMIVWGGDDAADVRTGGRYRPDPVGPPVTARAGEDPVVECTGPESAVVTLAGGGTSCPPGRPLSYTWSGNFPEGGGTVSGASPGVTLPLGRSTVTLRVDDGDGHRDSDEIEVTVRDTTPPLLTCPLPEPVECTSAAGTPVAIPPPVVSDRCDAAPVLTSSRGPGPDPSGSFPLGGTEVAITATDAAGNQAACSFPVLVRDTTPPQLLLDASPRWIWPPNHRLVEVQAEVAATDACGLDGVTLTSVASSEFDDLPGPGDGATSGDVQGAAWGTPDFDFQLRAERDGAGIGRDYRISYEATDLAGHRTGAVLLISVPHDQGGDVDPLILETIDSVSGTVLTWDAVSGASSYSVIRGRIGDLRERGAFIDLGEVACMVAGTATPGTLGHADAGVPPLGEAFFYLGAYDDGQSSGYGSDTASKPRLKSGGGCD